MPIFQQVVILNQVFIFKFSAIVIVVVVYVAAGLANNDEYIVGSWSARSPVCPLILAYKIPRFFPFAKTVCVSVRKNSVDVSTDKK